VATDDTTYVWYVATALIVELIGGPAIGVLMYLARSGMLSSHLPELVQAHGSLQLLGWAGLFVAGMAQRLVPRLAGRPPVRAAALPLLVLLAGGAVLRAVGQGMGNVPGGPVALAGSLISAAGMIGVAVVLAASLLRRRSPMAGWVILAWSGCAWWGVWAILEAWGGVLGVSSGGLVPVWFDEPAVLVVTLGGIGSFIWAIQSRMVPSFFGRKQPTMGALAGPAVIYNFGLLVILVTLVMAAAGRWGGARRVNHECRARPRWGGRNLAGGCRGRSDRGSAPPARGVTAPGPFCGLSRPMGGRRRRDVDRGLRRPPDLPGGTPPQLR